MKITAVAPANIAFIKFWGKADEKLNVPLSNSLSMNLSEAVTNTTVEFLEMEKDEVLINEIQVEGEEMDRVVRQLDRIRKLKDSKLKARVESKNSFPKGAGIASSASGFAALSVAACKAIGLELSEKELSRVARWGSGSACRSVPDGYVEWQKGEGDETSYAFSLYPPEYWDLRDVIAVVDIGTKKVSTTEGHGLAFSSPFMKSRVETMDAKMVDIRKALADKDFTKFGEITEAEGVNMHAVMMTSNPAIYYWRPATLDLMLEIVDWRKQGLEAYFTMDAGANVHIICEGRNEAAVREKAGSIHGVKKIISNKCAEGTRIV